LRSRAWPIGPTVGSILRSLTEAQPHRRMSASLGAHELHFYGQIYQQVCSVRAQSKQGGSYTRAGLMVDGWRSKIENGERSREMDFSLGTDIAFAASQTPKKSYITHAATTSPISASYSNLRASFRSCPIC
jgi:hypothetical protein